MKQRKKRDSEDFLFSPGNLLQRQPAHSREPFFSPARYGFDQLAPATPLESHPKAHKAASHAQALAQQQSPCIWFDDWGDDCRDNNENKVVDDKHEQHNDGAHYGGALTAYVCENEALRALPHSGIRSKDKNRGIREAQDKKYIACENKPQCPTDQLKKVNVRYRVCIDIPIEVYAHASVPFPIRPGANSRDVDVVVDNLRSPYFQKIGWRELQQSENYQPGDFVANEDHAGIVGPGGGMINLGHPNRDRPGACNDIDISPRLPFGVSFAFRYEPAVRSKSWWEYGAEFLQYAQSWLPNQTDPQRWV